MAAKKTPEEFLEDAKKMIGMETEASTAPYDVEYEPLSQIRKTIAKNMLIAKQNDAHMTYTVLIPSPSERVKLR